MRERPAATAPVEATARSTGRQATQSTWSSVTCHEDGHSHAVADGVLAEGGIGSGRFPARCGRLIAPVALSAPEGPPCPLCG
jgi:hypothetical protein